MRGTILRFIDDFMVQYSIPDDLMYICATIVVSSYNIVLSCMPKIWTFADFRDAVCLLLDLELIWTWNISTGWKINGQTRGDEIQLSLCVDGWMSTSIPNFGRISAPLRTSWNKCMLNLVIVQMSQLRKYQSQNLIGWNLSRWLSTIFRQSSCKRCNIVSSRWKIKDAYSPMLLELFQLRYSPNFLCTMWYIISPINLTSHYCPVSHLEKDRGPLYDWIWGIICYCRCLLNNWLSTD